MEKAVKKKEVTYIEFTICIDEGKNREVASELRKDFSIEYEHGYRNFWIDFSSVSAISSSFVATMVFIYKQVGANGKLVISGINDSIREIFKISGFDSLNYFFVEKSV